MDGIAVAQGGAAGGRADESRALTGLRGVGAFLVMLHHFHHYLALDLHVTMLSGLLRKGYLGVDLFFVLSGFLMAMVYGPWFATSFETPHRTSLGQHLRATVVFLMRRVARVWPLHAVIIGLLVAEWMIAGQPVSLRLVAANLGMIQAWGISAEINPPAWSISTEIAAYLLFPLLAPVVLRWRWGVVLGVAAAVMAIALCMRFAPPVGPMRRGWMDIYFNYSALPLLRCLAGFVVGMVAWRLGHAGAVRRVVATLWTGPTALLLMIVLMLGRVNDLLIYPLLPIIVLGFHFGRGRLWAAFTRGPIYRVGVLSYAIYLVHVVLLLHFPLNWAPLGVELIAYLATVAVAAEAGHWLVEQPGRRLIRRWGEAILALAWPGALLQRGPGYPI